MKKIQTPISNSIGNQEIRICTRVEFSSGGSACTRTPRSVRRPTRPGSLGA